MKNGWFAIKNISSFANVVSALALVISAFFWWFTLSESKETTEIAKEKLEIEQKALDSIEVHHICMAKRSWYFRIYSAFKEDIDKKRPKKEPVSKKEKDSLIKEGERIARNTLRHFSTIKENGNLIIKALDNALSDNSSKELISFEDRRVILRDIIEGLNLKDKGDHWPADINKYDYYRSNEDHCFK